MSSFSVTVLDQSVQHLLAPSTSEQLRLSRHAAHRSSLTQALAERRNASVSRRPARLSLWVRLRRVVVRPRPA